MSHTSLIVVAIVIEARPEGNAEKGKGKWFQWFNRLQYLLIAILLLALLCLSDMFLLLVNLLPSIVVTIKERI